MLEQLHTLVEHDYLSCSTILSLASVNHSFLFSLRLFINKKYTFFWPTSRLHSSSSPLTSLLISSNVHSPDPFSSASFYIYSPLSVIVTPEVSQLHLPSYIIKITFTFKLPGNTPFSLPPNLKELYYSFNLPINQLPQGLEVLSVNSDGYFITLMLLF